MTVVLHIPKTFLMAFFLHYSSTFRNNTYTILVVKVVSQFMHITLQFFFYPSLGKKKLGTSSNEEHNISYSYICIYFESPSRTRLIRRHRIAIRPRNKSSNKNPHCRMRKIPFMCTRKSTLVEWILYVKYNFTLSENRIFSIRKQVFFFYFLQCTAREHRVLGELILYSGDIRSVPSWSFCLRIS